MFGGATMSTWYPPSARTVIYALEYAARHKAPDEALAALDNDYKKMKNNLLGGGAALDQGMKVRDVLLTWKEWKK